MWMDMIFTKDIYFIGHSYVLEIVSKKSVISIISQPTMAIFTF